MDDEAVAALAQASKTSEAEMKELVRHHHFSEKLEEKKFLLEQKREEREAKSWKDKSDELEYKMKLLDKYNELKNTHEWDDQQILSFYPDMKQIIDARAKEA